MNSHLQVLLSEDVTGNLSQVHDGVVKDGEGIGCFEDLSGELAEENVRAEELKGPRRLLQPARRIGVGILECFVSNHVGLVDRLELDHVGDVGGLVEVGSGEQLSESVEGLVNLPVQEGVLEQQLLI